MHFSFTKKDPFSIIVLISFRVNFLFWGNYFITYDNKFLKAGYNINL